MRAVIVVFVKAPVPGTVKRRLAPQMGAAEAAALYTAFARDVVAAARTLAGARVHIAYEARPEFPDPAWCDPSVPYFLQQGRDLGERMQAALAQARGIGAAHAVVIGSDLPGLPPSYLRAALAGLRGADVALGPSTDGGYYLVGTSRECPGLFDRVAWSTAEACAQTRNNAERRGWRVCILPTHRDIDTFEDLVRLWATPARDPLWRRAPHTRRVLASLMRNRSTDPASKNA